jgi:N utilization substance protein B
VQILYEMDLAGMSAEQAIARFWAYLGTSDGENEFGNQLVRGYASQKTAIDETIRSVSEHWRLERMATVDRNIIRLAVFELMTLPDVPRKVTLNEAVELAKRFGDEASPAFVNGVLDRIANDLGKE